MQLMANADKVIKPVDLHLAIMKPLSAKWLVEVMGEIGKRKDVIVIGFQKAGIVRKGSSRIPASKQG